LGKYALSRLREKCYSQIGQVREGEPAVMTFDSN
jgi:hypothetical protein